MDIGGAFRQIFRKFAEFFAGAGGEFPPRGESAMICGNEAARKLPQNNGKNA